MPKLPLIKTSRAELARHAEEVFSSQYLEYQYTFVEFFVEHMLDASSAFEGDMQQMLLLAVIGQAKIRAVKAAIDAGEDRAQARMIRSGISASRLADVTAIPRQTVRRKLAAMNARGWIAQETDGTWHLAISSGQPVVLDDLGKIDARAISRIARLYSDLHMLFAGAE
jgi:hypothetical protein